MQQQETKTTDLCDQVREELMRKQNQLQAIRRNRRDIEMLERDLEGVTERLGAKLRRMENGVYDQELPPSPAQLYSQADDVFSDHPWGSFN